MLNDDITEQVELQSNDAEDILSGLEELLDDLVEDFSIEESGSGHRASGYAAGYHGNLLITVETWSEEEFDWDVTFSFEDDTRGFSYNGTDAVTVAQIADRIRGNVHQ